MIRTRQDGSHYCDGSRCGYPLSWMDPDPEEPWDGCGAWTCLDCGDSMYDMPAKAAPVSETP